MDEILPMKQYLFDIETTGLTSKDQITVLGLLEHETSRYIIGFLAPPDRHDTTMDEVSSEVRDKVLASIPPQIANVCKFEFSGHTAESELLRWFSEEISERSGQNSGVRLVGYNSDKYDIPTLRSRYVTHGIPWGLSGCQSRDLYNTFEYKFNTTKASVDGFLKAQKKKFGNKIDAPVNDNMTSKELTEAIEEYGYTQQQIDEFVIDEDIDRPTTSESSLDGVHELLGGDITDADPFESSEEAVDAFFENDIESVILHNIIDLYATLELNNVVNEFVPATEINDRQL